MNGFVEDVIVGFILGVIVTGFLFSVLFLSPPLSNVEDFDKETIQIINNIPQEVFRINYDGSKKLYISVGDEIMNDCFVTYIDYYNGKIICEKEELRK